MDDEKPTTPNDGRVSFAKRTASPARPNTGLRGLRGKANLAADGSPMPPPPKQVRWAALALAISGVAALLASLSLFGVKDWLFRAAVRNNNDKKLADRQTVSQLHHAVDSTAVSSLVSTIVLLLALSFAARGVLRGRSWARWTVVALWVLATFTRTFASFTYLIGVASDEPIAFKIPSFISAAALISAVVLVSIKPSALYFALSKPARPDGTGPARRGGLFGPRPVAPARTASSPRTAPAARNAVTRPAREPAERGRAKQRASNESAAKGAELARARAKASKSRRSGV